ncbi:MAG: ABC transporter permease [Chloroflexota bacterium]
MSGRYGLGAYVLWRLGAAIPLILGVVVVNFLLIQLAPGDPTTVLVGDYPAPPDYVAQVRQQFGLDQPLPVRLVRYLGQLATGNLGYSFANREPVIALIGNRLAATAQLTLTAIVLATVAGVGLGAVAAARRGGAGDTGAQVVALVGYSVPEFWLGQLLIVTFAVALGWLPSQGNRSVRGAGDGLAGILEGLRYLLLPVLALSFRYIALVSRLTRTSVLEVLGSDFAVAARARGAPERTVLIRHALRNATGPIVTVVGYNLGFIFAGSALIETVFGWPGIGRLMFDSIGKRDYPVLLGVLLLISASVVLVNVVTDLVHAAIDPRVRLR